MGTRHVTAVILNKEYKVAQYGQWDGYPGGQGLNILHFLKGVNLETFKAQIAKCRFLTIEERNSKWEEHGADMNSDWVSCDIANAVKNAYPALSRDTGSEILSLIYEEEVNELENSLEFVKNSLWCEWAYVIDLDKETFEVYEGFNREGLDENERFFFDGYCYDSKSSGSYYPVKLTKSYSLNNLPSEDEFLADFEEKDEE